MKSRELTWRHLKALNQLYDEGRTNASLTDNGYIVNILMGQKKLIRFKSGNNNIIEAAVLYVTFYEKNFKEDFERYELFLRSHNLQDDARRKYTEEDIKTMMFIAYHKDELVKELTTIRTFSSEIFKDQGSKYLENKPGLRKAVCKILSINDFPDKDPKTHQWRIVVDCLNPISVILCENIAHLKNPWKARGANVDLWYVGGNNINIIHSISDDKLTLPIFYSCDWDYHGLSIYSRIKEILASRSCNITLLRPENHNSALPVNSPHHYSKWDYNKTFSGLKQNDFSTEEKLFIEKLITENKWIEEESFDPFILLKSKHNYPH